MPIIITNEELRTTLGKDLDAIAGKLPADKDFVLVPKEDHIPKTRFDEVNTTVKDYKAQIAERDKQLADLTPKAKGHDELTAKLKELQELNAKTVTDYETKITERDRTYALNDTLRTFKPRNAKAVAALLDHSKIEYKDGTLKGAAEQLEAIRKAEPYLFAEDEQTLRTPFTVGRPPISGTQGVPATVDDILKRSFHLEDKVKK